MLFPIIASVIILITGIVSLIGAGVFIKDIDTSDKPYLLIILGIGLIVVSTWGFCITLRL